MASAGALAILGVFPARAFAIFVEAGQAVAVFGDAAFPGLLVDEGLDSSA